MQNLLFLTFLLDCASKNNTFNWFCFNEYVWGQKVKKYWTDWPLNWSEFKVLRGYLRPELFDVFEPLPLNEREALSPSEVCERTGAVRFKTFLHYMTSPLANVEFWWRFYDYWRLTNLSKLQIIQHQNFATNCCCCCKKVLLHQSTCTLSSWTRVSLAAGGQSFCSSCP